MKRALYILALISLLSGRAGVGYSQDNQRLGERTIMGTARYVGMGGAMTAIGGDPSASLDNPAGLGLYRHHEVMLTLDDAIGINTQRDTNLKGRSNIFMAPQASIVIHIPTGAADGTGVQAHNFLFSYHRVQSYNRLFDVSSGSIPSLGELFASTGADLKIPYCAERMNNSSALLLREWGYVNEYTLDWATNIANKWYVGLGLRIHSFSFSGDAQYDETFDVFNAQQKAMYNINRTTLVFNGAGVGLAAGFIYRPVSWLRLGFGLETPSLGRLRRSTRGDFYALTDTLRSTWYDTDKEFGDYHQPLHLSTSLAFQVNYYALIAFQYDYRHQAWALDNHSLRAGLEVIPIPGLYINAGYVFESAFSRSNLVVHVDPTLKRQDVYFQRVRWTQYVSGGIGYRGANFVAQLAYQYRWQRMQLYAHENALDNPYDLNTATHRIVLTLGWRR